MIINSDTNLTVWLIPYHDSPCYAFHSVQVENDNLDIHNSSADILCSVLFGYLFTEILNHSTNTVHSSFPNVIQLFLSDTILLFAISPNFYFLHMERLPRFQSQA